MQKFKMPCSEKTASIGISFDVPNKKETIIIGSPEDVKLYFTTGVLSEYADIRTRKIGTLIDEMNALAQSDTISEIGRCCQRLMRRPEQRTWEQVSK